ncbi:NAD(+) diphosphatase [Mycobacterium sp. 1274761.0]|uniref:NAD(+) diphosphatase n=1 Tax=Mycobacterium sp. 1274761.0 TaxID=1834077 RepID=UPI000800CC0F|nr:NAD(+) diphosphatase [Mycobacterium sp. 1274761.0]OBK74271.1 NADH pyrophosphatase [Mycobacterium sp. 1274761.0]
MTSLRLRNVPLLSRVGADRADAVRTDIDAAVAGWPEALLLRVDSRNQVLIADGRAVLGKASALGDKPPDHAVFLGRLTDGRHVWAVRSALVAPENSAGGDTEVLDLRRAGHIFDDVSAQLVATATALLNWHDRARFSTVDGSPTKPVKAGWARVNPLNGHEDYPRIDPAVICLIHDGHDRAVLARQTMWPERLFSLLAGFVEAGESFEACVAREIAEEIGLTVRDVTYLGSQPWPFPRSLMVGFHAIADPEQEFVFHDGEIAEAAWFTRDEIREALAHGDWSSDSGARLLLPGSISIAREIIESWAAQD